MKKKSVLFTLLLSLGLGLTSCNLSSAKSGDSNNNEINNEEVIDKDKEENNDGPKEPDDKPIEPDGPKESDDKPSVPDGPSIPEGPSVPEGPEPQDDTIPDSDMKWITISPNNFSVKDTYKSGNYGTTYSNGYTFNYYRATLNDDGDRIRLLGSTYFYADHGLGGMISNSEVISDIRKITVKGHGTGTVEVSTYLSANKKETSSFDAENLNESVYLNSGASYFEFSCVLGYIDVEEIKVGYLNKQVDYESKASYEFERKSVKKFDGELIDGVSKIELPNSKTTTKTYTYYSNLYVYEHSEELDISKISCIDPIDVSNYYIAFGAFPPNYAFSSDLSDFSEVFGSYLRQVSTYDRTTGYAKSVPYNVQPGRKKPIYHELDIDLDGTYDALKKREVGRIVAWEYGFTCYDDAPVCVFTDDHYATFQEYNNNGEFAPRFDAEMNIVHRRYCALNTL